MKIMSERIPVAIVGVSGYAGGELARLLSRHPGVEIVAAVSETYAGKPLKASFPGLAGSSVGEIVCEGGGVDAPGVARAEVVFLAQESGFAMRSAPALIAVGKGIVDLSADFRLRDLSVFSAFYKLEHTAPELFAGSTVAYGLPERNLAALRQARLVANPGCHVTAATLALAPLLESGVIEKRGIVIDSKTGVSGAGRAKNDLLFKFSEANESVTAYGVGGTHRHTPEIEQTLSEAAGEPVIVTFTPHLIPMTRGILSTCYGQQTRPGSAMKLTTILRDAYRDAPFVVVRDAGDQPKTKDVLGSNYCHLCVAVDERTGTAIVTSALDNLVKGAAGQAVQNMNILLDLSQTAGLEGAGLWP
ncbi:MAG: N-acetyl-gamma-glutamyl-phosphate reductase [Fibrella sp.]|nr:N-acetyl-gamma-glutamyl-phosphate reductase [Armatimonadota bacterium]